MWGLAGWLCGALAAAAVLLALAARARARARNRSKPPNKHASVHIVRVPLPARLPRPPRLPPRPARLPPRSFLTPRRILAALTGKPADEPPPTIVIVRNTALNTVTQNTEPNNPDLRDSNPSTSQALPRLPLPEQWLHKRPVDYKYTTIARPLAQLKTDLGADLSQESRAKKYSATRSPSLEKDDKSPFLNSAKSDKEKEVFGFDQEIVRRLSEKEDSMMSPKKSADNSQDSSPSNLRRFRSVSTKLHMCVVNDNQTERLEMQNSPRVLECSSAKENSSVPKFDFSPKFLDTMTSPCFFTPPETVSPMFFSEPSPRSVYYDTVKSPKFFAETPRDSDLPQSPRTLGDYVNRNGIEKPSSPLILSAKPSPKLLSYNKENYFTFDQCNDAVSTPRASPRPRKYGGRNSIEREKLTPPADKEIRKYRRHNSCDTYKTVELNILALGDNKTSQDKDVVDCCLKIDSIDIESNEEKLNELNPNSAQARRQRLKSISLDSDNAKIIEQNLGLPIAKQMKDQMNEAYKNESTSCESIERYQKTPTNERPCFKFDDETNPVEIENDVEPKTPGLLQKKCLRQSSDTQAFIDMPRFSPKEFEIIVTSEEGATVPVETQKPKTKNLRNLTIDLTKRDSDLEKELLEFEKLYTDAEEKKVKTPTLKIKATSLDSSETVNLSLPQKKALEVPQNSVSVPNTPKRQLKRILAQKNVKQDFCGGKLGFAQNAEQRRLFMKGQDSGIYLREHHANLMLYQPGTSRMGSRTMGSFDENTTDYDSPPEINICGADNRAAYDTGQFGQSLGSNLLNYKQNLSVSSTNLKTLPEGVPSDDFEPSAEDEKVAKKLYRRNSNQSLTHTAMLSTHSLQSSNCSLNSATSSHNIATVRTSISNYNLNDNRHKLSLDRRESSVCTMSTDHLTPTTRVGCSSNASLSGDGSKNCLLQRRGSNNSLTLNICSSNLSRHSSCSNSSLNKDAKHAQKKGLLERRSSNTSLTLNINNSNPQLSVNAALSVSNYNLNGSSCNLSRCSNDNAQPEPRKGILERRSSNTSLTLNLNVPLEPREVEIDETVLDENLKDLHRDKQRKSLSTENLLPKSYKSRLRLRSAEKGIGFGSHDNLWSNSYPEPEYAQNLTYVCGDQENEIIYALGAQEDANFQPGFTRNITTKPLSPQSTSEDFRKYLANMQHLQNATSVLTRQQLRDLNNVFQNGYSNVKCHEGRSSEDQHCCSGTVEENSENPQMVIPEISSQPCSEYQKKLLRKMHQEFWDMPTNFQEKPIVSGSHTKNRYKTILPNEHSRFILRADVGTTEGYINANFVKGHEYTKNSYIATQGPLQNTMYDFWLMVHQNCVEHRRSLPLHLSNDLEVLPPSCGVQKVVMLTNFIENNRQKCEKYFPLDVDEEVTIPNADSAGNDSFVIKNLGLIKKPGYTIRKLDVRYSDSETDNVTELTAESDSQSSVKTSSVKTDKSDSCGSESETDAGKSDTDTGVSDKYPGRSVPGSGKSVPGSGKSVPGSGKSVTNNGKSENISVTVYHYWFHNWADHKCPKDVNALLNLSLDVLKNSDFQFDRSSEGDMEVFQCESPKPESKFLFPPLESAHIPCEVKVNASTPVDLSVDTLSPPAIVHCSAGIGRTGCLIAILNGIKQLTIESKVDVLGLVCNMRLNRGGMVQNSEQYELIHKVLCLYEQACLPTL